MTTIKGTINSVGTFQPKKGAAPGLRLKVETKEGESVTIHAGPSQYTMQQNFQFNAGDSITVTGSKIRVGFKSAIMASEIKVGDKTLKLRDEKGKPQWKTENMQMQQPQKNMEQRQQRMEESSTAEDYMG